MSRPAPDTGRAGGRRRAAPTPRRRRPPLGPLLVVVLALALVTAVVGAGVALLAGAGSPGTGPAEPGRTASSEAPPPSATSEASSGASPGASSGAAPAPPPPRRPAPRSCYDLDWSEALAYTSTTRPASCSAQHTARTYLVGDLPTLAEGHLLAVDSARARQAPARACPDRLGDFLGGDRDDLRLSMLRAVWFTPTLEESDRGAHWYRCDVVAVAGDERLAPLGGRLEGVLNRPADAAAYAVCGTAEPGTEGFERVACSEPHAWRAIEVVELGGGPYPGVATVRSAGQAPCEDAGRERAEDPLTFRWGYAWPTLGQWREGTTWGLCWVPD